MTVATIAETCSNRLQITFPTTGGFVTATDQNMILLKQLIEEACTDLKDEFPWPELQTQYTFTLATNTASYALPSDFDRWMNQTWWNSTQHWPLIGPIDAVLWQQYQSGLVTTLPRQRFRVKGWALKQFFIDPTPSSSENGQECVFEYITGTVIKPKTWVASTSWTGLRYCSYNGYIFDRGGTGAATTGASAPTPSSLNDGSITWTLYTSKFETFQDDSDNIILDNSMVTDRAVWRFKQERGLDFEDFRAQAENRKEITKTKLQGTSIVTINGWQLSAPMIGPWSYPEGNY